MKKENTSDMLSNAVESNLGIWILEITNIRKSQSLRLEIEQY